MTRFMTVAWIVQAFFFLLLAFCHLVLPTTFHAVFHQFSLTDMLANHELEPYARGVVAMMQIASPLVFAMALFSAHAAMREDAAARRQLARVFAVALGMWALKLYFKQGYTVMHTPNERILFFVITGFALVNLVHGFVPVQRSRVRALSGMANTRPPQLWILWLVQGVLFSVLGVAIAVANHSAAWATAFHEVVFRTQELDPKVFVHTFLGGDTPHEIRIRSIIRDELEVLPPFLLCLSLLSFYAMQVSREWIWRLQCGLFGLTFFLQVVVSLLVWDVEIFNPLAFPIITGTILFFLLANRRFGRREGEYFTRDVGQGPDGWTVTDLLAGPILAVRTLIRGGRRSRHRVGVGASGHFEVVAADQADFPQHGFFEPGKRFPLQARFSNVSLDDDASLDARGAALRFSQSEASPFDLNLNTGAFSDAENMAQFLRVVVLQGARRRGRRLASTNGVQAREAAIAGLRRAPECYSGLCYYSQVVRFWVSTEDVSWLVRYRLVPGEASEVESGLPGAEGDLHDRERLPSERRAADYLRREIKRKLEGARVVTLRLQGQFHRPVPGDGLEWYNPAVDWHTGDHPWHDVGYVVLENALPDDVTEQLQFNPGNHPPTLGIPSASHPWDYRSMADSERRVVGRLQGLRRWIHGAFGVPTTEPKLED